MRRHGYVVPGGYRVVATVLLVDDDRADLMLLQEAVQVAEPGLGVKTARTAAEAMEEVRGVDLVLMDLNMPGTSGFDIIRQLRKRTKLVPIVVLTTSAATGDIDRAYEVGANAFITKPEDLTATIEMMRLLFDFWFKYAVLVESG